MKNFIFLIIFAFGNYASSMNQQANGTSEQIKNELNDVLKSYLPKELVIIMAEYANTDFENEYCRLFKIVEDNDKWNPEFYKTKLVEIRKLRKKLQELKYPDNSIIDDVIRFEVEVFIKCTVDLDYSSFTKVIRPDYQYSDQDLLKNFSDYFETNRYDVSKLKLFNIRVKRLLLFLIIKDNNSGLIHEICKIHKKFGAALNFIKLRDNFNPFSFLDIEECKKFDDYVKKQMDSFNADEYIQKFKKFVD